MIGCVKIAIVYIVVGLVLVSAGMLDAEPLPKEIVDNMHNTYSVLTSYSGTGFVEIAVSVGDQEKIIVKPFNITFKRPDSLRVEWTDSFGGVPTPYVLWNTQSKVFIYAKRMKQLVTCKSIGQAIKGQSGTSGGVVQHIPDMLLGVSKTPQYGDLDDIKPVIIEAVDGVACYKVSGIRKGTSVNLWIGENDFILRKIVTSTPFGVVTERHRDIQINIDIADAAILFTPPDDAERVDQFDVRKNSGGL